MESTLLNIMINFIIVEVNQMLNSMTMEKEIKRVAFMLNSYSVSGSDGFTGHFY